MLHCVTILGAIVVLVAELYFLLFEILFKI